MICFKIDTKLGTRSCVSGGSGGVEGASGRMPRGGKRKRKGKGKRKGKRKGRRRGRGRGREGLGTQLLRVFRRRSIINHESLSRRSVGEEGDENGKDMGTDTDSP